MGALLQRALDSAHAAQWHFLRGSWADMSPLLPFLKLAPGDMSDAVISAQEDGHVLCVMEVRRDSESPLFYESPIVSVAFTETADGLGIFESASVRQSALPSATFAGLLHAVERASRLNSVNRILSAFRIEERADLEFEPWHRHLMDSLGSLITADAVQFRLRTAHDFWESKGDCWNWLLGEAVVAVPEMDARMMSDVCRGGALTCLGRNEIERRYPIEAADLQWMAHLPLRSRTQTLGVLTLCYARPVTPFAEEIKLLELLQREMSVYMERTRNHLHMQRMATIDGLTNLYNHRFFRIQLRTEFQRALRYQKKMSLVMIDIDDFKSYNDRCGHLAGDRVLAEIGRTIRSTVRDIDFVARYGGEEFALILPEVDSTGGLVVAEKIRVAIGAQQFKTESGEDLGSITVSCGVTDNMNTTGPNDLIRRADRALYWVKTHGRNLVRLADAVEDI